jgi:hypothetical protein
MWQTLVVLIVVALALVYVVRHYVRLYHSDVPACSGCEAGCCGSDLAGKESECTVGKETQTQLVQWEKNGESEENHFTAG